VVNSLWRGEWVQRNNENEDIDYVPYHRFESASFWDHLNPERIAVPRYQAAFRIAVWILFLFGEKSGPLWAYGRWKVEGGRWKVEGGRWKVERADGCTQCIRNLYRGEIVIRP
jgi:hypothetical protein